MLRVLAAVAAIAVVGTLAYAQNLDAIKQRQTAMKGMLEAYKAPTKMMKGEMPFELAPVQAALKTFQNTAKKAPNLFPEDSKTGADTDALPAIWQNKADFTSRFDKLHKAAASAEAT